MSFLKQNRWIIAALPAIVACAPQAWAREDLVPGSRYTSARGEAMGDAYLPLADDAASALFYNPAALAKGRNRLEAEPFNIQIYGNGSYLALINPTNPTFYKVTSLSSYLPTLQANPGSYVGVGTTVLPAFQYRGLAFGLMYQTQLAAVADSSGHVSYRSLYQLVPAVGGAIKLASGIVRLGYSLQWVQQASGNLQNTTASSGSGYNQNLEQGSALSNTLGFALTLPYRNLPSLNIVARNLFTAKFINATFWKFSPDPTGTPADEPTTFDASFSFVSKVGPASGFRFVFEDRDFTDQSRVSILGRLAAGVEFSYRESVFLRGGWGSGYPDAGLGFRAGKSELSFTWAAEEIGTSYHSQEDRRYLMQYQVRAF